jgi:hypothetical protein
LNLNKERWEWRLDFAAFSAWLLLGLVLAIIAYEQYGKDFRGYYSAAQVLVEGGNPYDYNEVVQVLQEVTGSQGNNPYYYPPWFAWIFVPLTPLPFATARGVWMFFNYLLWYLALARLHEALGWSLRGWRLYSVFAVTTFSFAWITWRYEQAGILVLVILVELILSLKAEKWFRAGVWLALLMVKPNVTLIIGAGLALWLIRRKLWQPILVAFLVSVVLLAASTWITPDWYRPIFDEGFSAGLTHRLDGPDNVVAYRINSTFSDWLATFGITQRVRSLLYTSLALVGLAYLIHKIWNATSLLQVAGSSTLVSLGLTPYALQYDYPLLVIPFFVGLSISPASQISGIFRALIALFVVSVIFWQRNISWAYWMVVGLIAMEIWGYWQLKSAPNVMKDRGAEIS